MEFFQISIKLKSGNNQVKRFCVISQKFNAINNIYLLKIPNRFIKYFGYCTTQLTKSIVVVCLFFC